MNYFDEFKNFRVDSWPLLESLTIDLYSLRGSNKLLKEYLQGDFNLKSLRIFDCRLRNKTLADLSVRCQQLECLQLIDVTFNVSFLLLAILYYIHFICFPFSLVF